MTDTSEARDSVVTDWLLSSARTVIETGQPLIPTLFIYRAEGSELAMLKVHEGGNLSDLIRSAIKVTPCEWAVLLIDVWRRPGTRLEVRLREAMRPIKGETDSTESLIAMVAGVDLQPYLWQQPYKRDTSGQLDFEEPRRVGGPLYGTFADTLRRAFDLHPIGDPS